MSVLLSDGTFFPTHDPDDPRLVEYRVGKLPTRWSDLFPDQQPHVGIPANSKPNFVRIHNSVSFHKDKDPIMKEEKWTQ